MAGFSPRRVGREADRRFLCYLALDRNTIASLAILRSAHRCVSVLAIDQLGVHPHASIRPLHTAFHHVSHAEDFAISRTLRSGSTL